MNFKRPTALAAASLLMLSAFTACSSTPPAAQTNATTSQGQSASDDQQQGFVLKYPQDMQALGYTDEIHLDKLPSRVATMSTYPVMTLYALGINMVAVPSTKVVNYPDDLKAEQFPGLMSDQFDLERVVATEPDLVILPASARDTHGATLKELGIPVYYVAISAQKDVPIYTVIKNQTQALIDAFAADSAAQETGKELMQRFTDLEGKIDAVKQQYKGKKVLVLMSSDPTSHFIQSESGVLGSMLSMLGFENVYSASGAQGGGHNSAPLDMEKTLDYQPDLVVFTGNMDKAGMEDLAQKTIAQNPAYWNSIEAIASGEYLCLPANYVSTAGIGIIDNLNDLIDIVEAHYAD